MKTIPKMMKKKTILEVLLMMSRTSRNVVTWISLLKCCWSSYSNIGRICISLVLNERCWQVFNCPFVLFWYWLFYDVLPCWIVRVCFRYDLIGFLLIFSTKTGQEESHQQNKQKISTSIQPSPFIIQKQTNII